MKKRILQAIVAMVLGVGLLMQGCVPLVAAGAGAAAAIGATQYANGDSETSYAASFDRTWNAALGAVRDQALQVTDMDKKPTEGEIKARQADGTPVSVDVEQKAPNVTEVSIRVGTFGDEAASHLLANRIASRLGTAAR